MPHDVSLIATIAAAFGLALVLGLAAAKLRLPPLVGYLLAGIVIGPATPGFVADVGLAAQLAEIGVMLLMFGVGLHFSLADLMAVRRIAVPGALVQIAVATAMGAGVALAWGWAPGGALVFGLSLSVASTVVLLRALEARGQLATPTGRIAVGWLVVEDLVMVLVLVLLPPLAAALQTAAAPAGAPAAPATDLWASIGLTLAKVGAFVALMLVLGRRALPRALAWVAHSGSRELFTLGVVAVAVGVAFASAKLFDVSFALGAFFAGMVLRESEFSQRAAEESLPLRDAFAVLFFVSVGMLFDPAVLWRQPLSLLGVLAIIVLGKTLAAVALVLLWRYPLSTAFTVGASLAQIGEFSFILAGLGMALGLLPREGHDLVLAAALLSIALNPLAFAAIEPLRAALLRRSPLARRLEQRDDPLAVLPDSTDVRLLSGHVLLVGHGDVGRRLARFLAAHQVPVVVAERDAGIVDTLRRAGQPAVCGDAATPDVLVQAHMARAAVLVLTVADAVAVRSMVDTARALNPGIDVLLCSPDDDAAALLEREGLGTAFVAAEALARHLADHVLRGRGGPGTTGAAAQRPEVAHLQ